MNDYNVLCDWCTSHNKCCNLALYLYLMGIRSENEAIDFMKHIYTGQSRVIKDALNDCKVSCDSTVDRGVKGITAAIQDVMLLSNSEYATYFNKRLFRKDSKVAALKDFCYIVLSRYSFEDTDIALNILNDLYDRTKKSYVITHPSELRSTIFNGRKFYESGKDAVSWFLFHIAEEYLETFAWFITEPSQYISEKVSRELRVRLYVILYWKDELKESNVLKVLDEYIADIDLLREIDRKRPIKVRRCVSDDITQSDETCVVFSNKLRSMCYRHGIVIHDLFSYLVDTYGYAGEITSDDPYCLEEYLRQCLDLDISPLDYDITVGTLANKLPKDESLILSAENLVTKLENLLHKNQGDYMYIYREIRQAGKGLKFPDISSVKELLDGYAEVSCKALIMSTIICEKSCVDNVFTALYNIEREEN